MRSILAMMSLAVIMISCGTSPTVIEVTNHGWPDGASILAVSGGEIMGRTRLYGDRARITVDQPGIYVLRVTGFGHLSSATSEFQLQPGITSITLPPPVSRTTIGGKVFGINLQEPAVHTAIEEYLTDTPPFTTLLVPSGMAMPELAGVCTSAHNRLVAVQVVYTDSYTALMLDARDVSSQLDSLALAGVDGIVLTVGPNELGSLFHLITHIHDRGMHLSAQIRAEDANVLPTSPTAEDTYPDNVLLSAAPITPSGSLNPVDEFDRALNSVWFRSFQLDRVNLSFSLSARTPEGLPKDGALQRALAETGGEGAFRLRDGSLRFGHRGASYQYDDLESIRQKLMRLHELGTGTIGGIYLEIDGRGIIPEPDDMTMIRDILQSW